MREAGLKEMAACSAHMRSRAITVARAFARKADFLCRGRIRKALGYFPTTCLKTFPSVWSENPTGEVHPERVDKNKTGEFWDREAGTWGLERGIHWTEHLAVQERFNLKIGGHIQKDLFLYFADFLRARGLRLPLERALTLGCGAGEFERALSNYNICQRHEGYDISPESIRLAGAKAQEEGLSHLSYAVRDLDAISLPPNTYDLVFGIQAVHHFKDLERVFSETRKALKPKGFFVLHEFVGPTRFQWSDRQMEIVTALLQVLPDRYCLSRKDGVTLMKTARRPTIEEMIRVDPSEAVRSGEIMKILPRYFDMVEIKPLGGTVLQLLLEGIAGNFDYNHPKDMRFLKAFFEIEDILMDLGDIPSDFVFIIAGKL